MSTTGRVPSYKVKAARAKNYNPKTSSKKQRTFKDNSDTTLFSKDYKDFLVKVDNSLKNQSDVENIKKNLTAALKRLGTLKKNMRKYVVVSTGSYFTDKVPKLPYSEQGRPGYYKDSKLQNKSKEVPYDKTLYVVVRRVNLSIVDKVTNKSIYKSNGINLNQDSYNRFFKNLIDVSFANIELPMKELKNQFYQSSQASFGSFVSNDDNMGANRIASYLGDISDKKFYDQINYNTIVSTIKALMFGGVNNTVNNINIKFFSSDEFYNYFSHSSVTNVFSKQEILCMLLNLSIAYSSYHYKQSKSKETLEVIAQIRANIIGIIRSLNTESDMNDDMPVDDDKNNSDNLEGTDEPDMMNSDVFETSTPPLAREIPTTQDAEFTDVSGSSQSSVNPSMNTGTTASGRLGSSSSTANTLYPAVIIYPQNNENVNNDSSITPNISAIRGPDNGILKPGNSAVMGSGTKNLIDVYATGSSNYPSNTAGVASNTLLGKRARDYPTTTGTIIPIPQTATDIKNISAPSNMDFTQVFTSQPASGNNYTDETIPKRRAVSSLTNSNVPVQASGETETTNNLDKIYNLMGALFQVLYSIVSLITNENFDRSSLKNLFDSTIKQSGLRGVLGVDQTSLPHALLALENSIGNIVNNQDDLYYTSKASYDINLNNKDLINSMVSSFNKTRQSNKELDATNMEFKKQLRSLSKYLDSRSNANNLALRVSIANTDNEDEGRSTGIKMDQMRHMKEIVSILKSVLPMGENSMLATKMSKLES